MVKNSLPVGFIIGPLANVFATVCPSLGTVTFSHSIFPLTLVSYAIVELDWTELGDLFALEGGLDELVVFLGFAAIEQICIAVVEFTVSVSLWLWLLLFIVFFSGSSCGIFLLFLLFIQDSAVGTFFISLFCRFLFFFGLFLWNEFLILYGFVITILTVKDVGFQIVLDLFFLVGVDLEWGFLYFCASANTDSHFFIEALGLMKLW